MGRIAALTLLLLATSTGIGASGANPEPTREDFAIPQGYRDWPVIAVAREEGKLDDLRATLGNRTAISAARGGGLHYPDGSIIVRVAWSYEPLKESAAAFGHHQSYVAGQPKNGVQFMIKDSSKYRATNGWGYAQFEEGKPVTGIVPATCHACHSIVAARDFVFSRYAE